MIVDALVLAGGRSSRLGGLAKAELIRDGTTLLGETLDAVRFARTVVVVGAIGARSAREGVRVVRETPMFSGPAAAVAAGVASLPAPPSGAVLILACDMPGVRGVARALRAAALDLEQSAGDGVVGVDSNGRAQPLASLILRPQLDTVVTALGATVQNLSMRALFSSLDLLELAFPPCATDDVDTPEDARRFGIALPIAETRMNP